MAETKSQLISQERLRDMFEYRDGNIYWKYSASKPASWNTRLVGKAAGYLNKQTGYRDVFFDLSQDNPIGKRRSIGVHRIVFCLHYGFYPPTIDHINGDRSDNRIENLRAATSCQNAANRMADARNTTGVPGVRLHKDGRYEARVQFNGKRHQIGSFQTIEEARSAIIAASQRIKGEWHSRECFK